MKMYELMIPNELLNKKPTTLAMYISMEIYSKYSLSETIIMPFNKINLDMFDGTYKTTSRRQRILMEGYDELEGLNVLDIDCEKSYVIIQRGAFKCSKYYTLISLDEYNTIMNLDCKSVDKWSLLRTFCWLINSFDSRMEYSGLSRFVGHMSQEYFVNNMNISRQTLSNHIQRLQKEKLICYYVGEYRNKNVKRTSSYYGRYYHKELIEQFVEANKNLFLNNQYTIKTAKMKKITAEYKRFVADPDNYDGDVSQLKEDTLIYNSYVAQNKMGGKHVADSNLSEKDIDVFTGYCK